MAQESCFCPAGPGSKKRPLNRIIQTVGAAIVLAWAVGWADPAVRPSEQYVEGEAIVTFKSGVSLVAARQTVSAHSLELTKHFAQSSLHQGRHSFLLRGKTRTTP